MCPSGACQNKLDLGKLKLGVPFRGSGKRRTKVWGPIDDRWGFGQPPDPIIVPFSGY